MKKIIYTSLLLVFALSFNNESFAQKKFKISCKNKIKKLESLKTLPGERADLSAHSVYRKLKLNDKQFEEVYKVFLKYYVAKDKLIKDGKFKGNPKQKKGDLKINGDGGAYVGESENILPTDDPCDQPPACCLIIELNKVLGKTGSIINNCENIEGKTYTAQELVVQPQRADEFECVYFSY